MKSFVLYLMCVVLTLLLFSYVGFKAGRGYERASLMKPLKDAFVTMYMEGWNDGQKDCVSQSN